eukprot:14950708-Ditylum_brightwellii.AAC.1
MGVTQKELMVLEWVWEGKACEGERPGCVLAVVIGRAVQVAVVVVQMLHCHTLCHQVNGWKGNCWWWCVLLLGWMEELQNMLLTMC